MSAAHWIFSAFSLSRFCASARTCSKYTVTAMSMSTITDFIMAVRTSAMSSTACIVWASRFRLSRGRGSDAMRCAMKSRATPRTSVSSIRP